MGKSIQEMRKSDLIKMGSVDSKKLEGASQKNGIDPVQKREGIKGKPGSK